MAAEAATESATTQPHSPRPPPKCAAVVAGWGRADMAQLTWRNLLPPAPVARWPCRRPASLFFHSGSMDMFSWRYRVECKAARNPSSRPRWGHIATGDTLASRDRGEKGKNQEKQGPGWNGSLRCWEACRGNLDLTDWAETPANRSSGQAATGPCHRRTRPNFAMARHECLSCMGVLHDGRWARDFSGANPILSHDAPSPAILVRAPPLAECARHARRRAVGAISSAPNCGDYCVFPDGSCLSSAALCAV